MTPFLLKIALPPILVAVMSLAARLWGPTVGGLLLGLPWMTGPVLFFLALDKGDDFAVGACTGIQLGVVGVGGYILAYGSVALFARWPLSLAAAVGAYLAIAWGMQDVALPLWSAAGVAAVALAITLLLLPRPRTSASLSALPWWDIPARMAVTLALVSIIMLTADMLGAQLSGIASTFPVIFTVIGAFTHRQWGRDAVLRVLRGLTVSLLAFVVFFLVVGAALPAVGLAISYALATAAALPVSALLLAFSRHRVTR